MLGSMFMVLATFFWGSSFIFAKWALQEMGPAALVFWRFLLAGGCMAGYARWKKVSFHWHEAAYGVLLGIFLGGYIFFETLGLVTITASLCSFMLSSAVLLVPFLLWIGTGKRPKWLELVAVFAALVGAAFIMRTPALVMGKGAAYTAVSAVLFALHTCFIAIYAPKANILTLSWTQLLTVAVIALGQAYGTGAGLGLPQTTLSWGSLLALAILCSCVSLTIQMHVQRYLSATHAAILLTLEPLFATLLGYLLLHEHLHLQFYVGAAILLFSVLLVTIAAESA